MGTSTISQIVLETCSVLFQVLNEDFLKVGVKTTAVVKSVDAMTPVLIQPWHQNPYL